MVEAIEIELARSARSARSDVAVAVAVASERAEIETSAESVALLQAVADPIRWAVLARLADGTHCVCDLQTHVPIAANLLSYHLRMLREAGLVVTSRRGRWVDYALAPDARARLCAALPLPLAEPERGTRP